MTPLPDAARYFVALSDHAHKAYSEADLRRLYGERVIQHNTLIAPVNTTNWKPLGTVIPDLPTPRPLADSSAGTGISEPTIAHFVSPAPPSPPSPEGPPFLSSRYQRGNTASLFGTLAFLLLGVGFLVGTSSRGSTFSVSTGGLALFALAGLCLLLAVIVGQADAAAARQDAMLAALNHLIARSDPDTAKSPEAAPTEEK